MPGLDYRPMTVVYLVVMFRLIFNGAEQTSRSICLFIIYTQFKHRLVVFTHFLSLRSFLANMLNPFLLFFSVVRNCGDFFKYTKDIKRLRESEDT